MSNLPSWAPKLPEVASELMARTRIPNGELAGTFNTETEPTAAQATLAIEKAVTLIAPRLGPVAKEMEDQARALAALRAACVIERSFFPEQVETQMSPYTRMWAEYKDGLAAWDEAARGREPNGRTQIGTIHVGTVYPGYSTGTL